MFPRLFWRISLTLMKPDVDESHCMPHTTTGKFRTQSFQGPEERLFACLSLQQKCSQQKYRLNVIYVRIQKASGHSLIIIINEKTRNLIDPKFQPNYWSLLRSDCTLWSKEIKLMAYELISKQRSILSIKEFCLLTPSRSSTTK